MGSRPLLIFCTKKSSQKSIKPLPLYEYIYIYIYIYTLIKGIGIKKSMLQLLLIFIRKDHR